MHSRLIRSACNLFFIFCFFVCSVSNAETDDQMFYRGLKAFDQNEYKMAAKLWLSAASSGQPRAQNGLGVIYRDGLGMPRNIEEAIYWFYKSAENGYAYGMYNLAIVLIGKGDSSTNNIEAYKWLYLATALNFDEQANHRLYILANRMSKLEIKEASIRAQQWFDGFFFEGH